MSDHYAHYTNADLIIAANRATNESRRLRAVLELRGKSVMPEGSRVRVYPVVNSVGAENPYEKPYVDATVIWVVNDRERTVLLDNPDGTPGDPRRRSISVYLGGGMAWPEDCEPYQMDEKL